MNSPIRCGGIQYTQQQLMNVLLQIGLATIWEAAKKFLRTGDLGAPGLWNPFDSILFRALGWAPKEVDLLVKEAADELRACAHCGLQYDNITNKCIVPKGRMHKKLTAKLAKYVSDQAKSERS
jgi:hypothetical protein